MIISCICGKYEFEVSQNDIPKEGRNVQCGICNETWFQTPHEKISKLASTKSTHYFAYLFLLFLISISFVGIMETFREDLLYNFTNWVSQLENKRAFRSSETFLISYNAVPKNKKL